MFSLPPSLDELTDLHLALRYDCSAEAFDCAIRHVHWIHHHKLLTDWERDLWLVLLELCPGHDTCQKWCAYCGDVPDCECFAESGFCYDERCQKNHVYYESED